LRLQEVILWKNDHGKRSGTWSVIRGKGRRPVMGLTPKKAMLTAYRSFFRGQSNLRPTIPLTIQ
jgi:hypothetical protein